MTKEITGWEKKFKKQYTFNHEILGMIWKQGRAITPSMIESFISKAIASAVEARERKLVEEIKDFHLRQKEKSRNCPTCQSIRESGSMTATCANTEYHPWPDIRLEDILSIINPSKE